MVFRKIPFKNYVKYGIIVAVTIISCFILYTIYNNFKDQSVLRNKVSELNPEKLDEYIDENEYVLLYFGVINDDNSERIEEQLIKMIDKDNLDFIYVNISDLNNKKEYLKKFSEKYSSNKKIDNYPAFVYIKNREIIDVIQREDRYLKIDDVKEFVKDNDIIGEKDA